MRILRAAGDAGASVPWTEHFSGTAWMDLLLQVTLSPVGGDFTLTSVTFTPGVRTHWHRHEGGQLLIVLAGHGWVGSRDETCTDIRTGDVVWTAPGEDHWHGATENTTLTHLAVTLGSTRWDEEVVDPLSLAAELPLSERTPPRGEPG